MFLQRHRANPSSHMRWEKGGEHCALGEWIVQVQVTDDFALCEETEIVHSSPNLV